MESATTGEMPESRSSYINYGGEQVFQQPYAARNTRLYVFLLPIPENNRDLPQRLLDKVFNQTSGGAVDFRVALPYVLLSFQRFGDLGSELPPDSLKGGFAYNEATFWLPVFDRAAHTINFSYFVPYIFADNHYAIAAGREVYGYPKALGEIILPEAGSNDLRFTLRTEVIEKFSPDALGQKAALVDIVPGATQPESIWEEWAHAAEHLVGKVVDKTVDEVIEFTVEDLFQPKVEMVFLKQFRDVANGALACYQSIVRGAGAITGFTGGGPLGDDFQITINSYDSHPIAADLGLAPTIEAHGFYLDFSFNILPGEELWKAA
jgi:hypothetical protein